MARMFPDFGPKFNDSKYAEPLFYRTLKNELDDKFTVIHSIPWLSSFVSGLQNKRSPIGEIDFLILHPVLGALAVEVKGGKISHDRNGYYYTNTGDRLDPVSQLDRSMFALQRILENNGVKIKIGRGFYFPDLKMSPFELPPELVDYSSLAPKTLTIDINDSVGEKVQKIMRYHLDAFRSSPISPDLIDKILEIILPKSDYGACWSSRIKNDSKTWLKLTEQQKECVEMGLHNNRLLLNGWPGSGKTIILIQIARILSKNVHEYNRLLILTFNKLLAKKLEVLLKDFQNCDVYHFHKFCKLHTMGNTSDKDWLDTGAYQDLETAIALGKLDHYDSLLVDESQVIKERGWNSLVNAFNNKRIIAMCDVSQAFEYEEPVSLEFLENALGTDAITLATSLRVPKKVCNRMKLFNRPKYIVENPRELEDDSLNEIIVTKQEEGLKQIIASLTAEGIDHKDICVLTPPMLRVPSELVPQAISVENISRFRGLEKPIVIILPTNSMSDIEYFCSYSRATSKCIVILEAYSLKHNGYGTLGYDIAKNESERIENLLKIDLTSNLLRNIKPDLDLKEVNSSLNLYWSRKWRAYLLLGLDEALKNILTICFKLCEGGHVFSYGAESRGSLTYISDLKVDLLEYNNFDCSYLKHCSSCNTLVPERLWMDLCKTSCFSCHHKENERDFLFERDIDEFTHAFGYSPNNNLDGLPLVLSLFNQLKLIDRSALSRLIKKSSRLISCLISIHVLIRLEEFISENILLIETNPLQKQIKEENEIFRKIELMKWNGYFQDCLLKLEGENILAKSKKGFRGVTPALFQKT
ncbi:AAA family ATPase [Shewanella sp. 3B26]|uniref:AAA family ATPase n=1 Tax=Shewanella zhuhaiensis TaxID=2919576 RepID=A0AAJ1F958_9GAMM|nr:AAA family ATPase [Shewanella zhuhaiensis]MCH4292895.1 AAA family ATPase [Shewanella zhuhaiensis]